MNTKSVRTNVELELPLHTDSLQTVNSHRPTALARVNNGHGIACCSLGEQLV